MVWPFCCCQDSDLCVDFCIRPGFSSSPASLGNWDANRWNGQDNCSNLQAYPYLINDPPDTSDDEVTYIQHAPDSRGRPSRYGVRIGCWQTSSLDFEHYAFSLVTGAKLRVRGKAVSNSAGSPDQAALFQVWTFNPEIPLSGATEMTDQGTITFTQAGTAVCSSAGWITHEFDFNVTDTDPVEWNDCWLEIITLEDTEEGLEFSSVEICLTGDPCDEVGFPDCIDPDA